MDELKRAYEILGVKQEAEKKEVENRYFILLKRHQTKMKSANEEERAAEEQRFAPINQAYRQIIDHLNQKTLENNPVYIAEQKKHPLRRRVEEFFFVYKLPFFLGLISLIFVVSLVYSIATKEPEQPSDLSTMLVGNFYSDEIETFENRMASLVPGWERVAVTLNLTPHETNDSFDIANMEKSMVLLASERPEIYIVDKWQFERIGGQMAFKPLDTWEDDLSSLVGEERLLYAQFEEDTQQHLYGVNLADSSIFNDDIVRLAGDTAFIFTMRSTVEDPEPAMQLIRAIAETLDQ